MESSTAIFINNKKKRIFDGGKILIFYGFWVEFKMVFGTIFFGVKYFKIILQGLLYEGRFFDFMVKHYRPIRFYFFWFAMTKDEFEARQGEK